MIKMNNKLLLIIFFILALHLSCLNINSIEYLNIFSETSHKLISQHYIIGVIGYMLIYVIINVCCLPFSGALRIISGALFGEPGIIYALVASTLSASILYWIAKKHRHIIHRYISNKDTIRMGLKFKKKPIRYLILLRLLPIFPAWLVSIAAGIYNLDFKKFLLISALGFIPSTLFYVNLGLYNNDITNFIFSRELIPIFIICSIIIGMKSLKKRNQNEK